MSPCFRPKDKVEMVKSRHEKVNFSGCLGWSRGSFWGPRGVQEEVSGDIFSLYVGKPTKTKRGQLASPHFSRKKHKMAPTWGPKILQISQDGLGRALRAIFMRVKKRPQHRMLLRPIFCRFGEVFWGSGGGKNRVFAGEWYKF